jgi:hypothetical protein
MATHSVYEPDSVYDNLDSYNVGDTVEYISNNQMGYAQYVVEMRDGRKTLRQTDDWEGPVPDYGQSAGSGDRKAKSGKSSDWVDRILKYRHRYPTRGYREYLEDARRRQRGGMDPSVAPTESRYRDDSGNSYQVQGSTVSVFDSRNNLVISGSEVERGPRYTIYQTWGVTAQGSEYSPYIRLSTGNGYVAVAATIQEARSKPGTVRLRKIA